MKTIKHQLVHHCMKVNLFSASTCHIFLHIEFKVILKTNVRTDSNRFFNFCFRQINTTCCSVESALSREFLLQSGLKVALFLHFYYLSTNPEYPQCKNDKSHVSPSSLLKICESVFWHDFLIIRETRLNSVCCLGSVWSI